MTNQINWLSDSWLNDEALYYKTDNGYIFTSSNWDMRNVVYVEYNGFCHSKETISKAMFEFGCFFGINVHHRLNGFRGWDTIKFEFI